jgi:hypothetical protein
MALAEYVNLSYTSVSKKSPRTTSTRRCGAPDQRVRSGILNAHEITTTFANIQEVRLSAGPLQKLLGLADVEVHSAEAVPGSVRPAITLPGSKVSTTPRRFVTSSWPGCANTAIPDWENEITPALSIQ